MNKVYTVKFNSCGKLVVVSEISGGVKVNGSTYISLNKVLTALLISALGVLYTVPS
ncbi:hypothetical protein SedNR2807_00610 [Citrobacter sedlakii]